MQATARPPSGFVRDASGRAIAGASVCALSAGQACCEPERCTTSGADGRFALAFAACGLAASASGFVAQQLELPACSAADPVVLTLAAAEQLGASVTGEVLDATGGPVAGAVVTALQGNDPSGAPRDMTQTDEHGFFRLKLEQGEVELQARMGAYSVASRHVFAPVAGVRLLMAPGSGIRGRVVRADDGAPVEGVDVGARGENGLRWAPASVRSASDGSFAFDALPAGGYSLAVSARHWRSQQAWVVVGVGETSEEVRVLVTAAASLSGKVQVAGTPCTLGSLQLRGPVEQNVTIQHGTLQVDGLLPGSYTAQVSCAPAGLHEDSFEMDDQDLARDYDLAPGLAVRGRVERQGGQPFAGATVLVTPSASASADDAPIACTADADGRFECRGLAAGNYEVRVSSDLDRASELVPVTLGDADVSVVLHADASASIRATLSQPDGAGRDIGVFARTQGSTWSIRAEPRDGAYVFADLPLGSYEVFVGRSSDGATPVELAHDGQLADVVLSSPPKGTLTISGRVADGAGEAVVDAWVQATVEDASGDTHEAANAVLTDELGQFVFQELNEGVYAVHATSARGEGHSTRISAGARDVVIRLPAFGSVSGTLLHADGTPVARGNITAQHSGGQSFGAEVSDGRWMLPWTPPGTYQLSSEAMLTTETVELAAGSNAVVSLRAEHSERGTRAP